MKSSLIYIKKPELFKELTAYQSRFYAVIDEKVKSHLPDWIVSSSSVYWIQEPEREKNLDSLGRAIEFFLQQGITRSDHLIALGGGATTDFGGFVAASILRGIGWVAVPTTLLAMVDASIGGKVGINMPQGKNLMGAFYLPQKIFLCDEFLKTLVSSEIHSGKGEILKYGFLSSKIYDLIIKKAPIDEIMHECARYKEELVERDFMETADRIQLNLGHTLGHAFEFALNIPHGLAVAMGIKYLLMTFDEKELLKEWERLVSCLGLPEESLSLKHYPHLSQKKLIELIGQDKKRTDTKIRLVLIEQIGKANIIKMNLDEFIEKIEQNEVFKN